MNLTTSVATRPECSSAFRLDKEDELAQKSVRLAELNVLLNMEKPENKMVDDEPDEEAGELVRASVSMER